MPEATKNVKITLLNISLVITITMIMLILFFIISIGLGVLLIYLGIVISTVNPDIFPHVIGLIIGFIGVSFILITLSYFFKIKKPNNFDSRYKKEISRDEHPKFFEIIDDINKELNKNITLKVYLTNDTSASVSNLHTISEILSKNKRSLQLGIGLIQHVNISELKSIIYHEYGHILDNNSRLESILLQLHLSLINIIQRSSNIQNNATQKSKSIIYNISKTLAQIYFEFIEWYLDSILSISNKYFFKIFRANEFKSDLLAAKHLGSETFRNALIRLDFIDFCSNEVLNFYQHNYKFKIIPQNIYKDQLEVTKHLSKIYKIPFENDRPLVTLDSFQKYKTSKIRMTLPWETHPNLIERIRAIEDLNIEKVNLNEKKATELLENFENIQIESTESLLKSVGIDDTFEPIDHETFLNKYVLLNEKTEHPISYNYFYSYRPITKYDFNSEINVLSSKYSSIEEVFSEDILDTVRENIVLNNDIHILENIVLDQRNQIKDFYYDEVKYTVSNVSKLINKLKKNAKEIENTIKLHEDEIGRFFISKAIQNNNLNELKSLHSEYNKKCDSYTTNVDTINKVLEFLNFSAKVNIINDIQVEIKNLKRSENKLKYQFNEFLNHEELREYISEEMRHSIREYNSKFLNYFENNKYEEENLTTLRIILDYFIYINNFYYNIEVNKYLYKQLELCKQ